MSEQVNISYNNLKKAYDQFLKAIDLEKNAAEGTAEKAAFGDAVIQRFEFTYELLWKTLKVYFKELGADLRFPKECFEKAFQEALIATDQEFIYLDMIKDRNLTSHDYGEKIAREVLERVKTRYVKAFDTLLQALKAKIK